MNQPPKGRMVGDSATPLNFQKLTIPALQVTIEPPRLLRTL